MKYLVVAAAFAALLPTQPPAHANYAWRFDPGLVTAENLSGGGFQYIPAGVPSKVAKGWLPSFVLTITDQAFASRAMDLAWSNCDGAGTCQIGGNISPLVSFTDPFTAQSNLFGYGQVDLAWTKRGRLTGDLMLEGMLSDLTLDWSGIGRQMGWIFPIR